MTGSWGARISYSENWHQGNQVQEHFSVFLHDMKTPIKERPVFGFQLPSNRYTLRQKFGAFEYVFEAKLERPTKPPFNARDHLSSAESLSNTVLKSIDQIQAMLEPMINDGKPSRVLDHDLMKPVPPTENPPVWGAPRPTEFTGAIPKKYALSDQQKTILKDQMQAELDKRRDLITSNAVQMHAALEQTFPLGKLLIEFDK